ncbi:universal stress protein [Halobacteria archaeon AArc-m2/3/4]|uniref:Universal stress protein n=1 Tax=Natronoglomus mannanivorans TaxID=2979990 RepID=A0AAP3E405_9EURY|nr:universal stress protein [Halobacteria archaeon AArc-xg1-1]MCU4974806.1 universal stress protein [Halobacteria archaeon AArc-m2/3/4]
MSLLTTDRVLIPIANEEDATETCDAIVRYFADQSHSTHPKVNLVHVIEKTEGYMDKAPLEAREQQAQRVFEIASDRLEEAGYEIETELVYSTNVVESIVETAARTNADAIVFLPRDGGRLSVLLSGNMTSKLVSSADIPVIVLPE